MISGACVFVLSCGKFRLFHESIHAIKRNIGDAQGTGSAACVLSKAIAAAMANRNRRTLSVPANMLKRFFMCNNCRPSPVEASHPSEEMHSRLEMIASR